jgi:hypothetical protein
MRQNSCCPSTKTGLVDDQDAAVFIAQVLDDVLAQVVA